MSGAGWRLTIGSILSLGWFFILRGSTDWPVVIAFIVAVIFGFCLSVIDLLFAAIFNDPFD